MWLLRLLPLGLVVAGAFFLVDGGSSPPTAAGSHTGGHKVVFVQGITSESVCGVGMVDVTTAMRDFLLTTQWVRDAVPLQPNDFHYFSYDPALTLSDRYCAGDPAEPDYTPKDTCWSIDDRYRGTGGAQKATLGSARRLNQLIADLTANDGLVKIDIIAHSQGGVVAAYWLEKFGAPANVNSLVTLDSPVGGLPALWSLAGSFNCGQAGVNLLAERWYDSPQDMQDGSAVNTALQGAPAKASVFTLRTSDFDVIIPNQAATFDGAACDSSADLVPSLCGAPAGDVVDFYAPLGNHSQLWHSPIQASLDLLGCAVTGDLSPCMP